MRAPHKIECLEARIAPATVVVPIGGSTAYTLHQQGANFEIVDASHTVVWSQAAASVTSLEIDDADSANDVLTVDFAGGLTLPTGGVSFLSGGAFRHGLAVLGDGTAHAVYTPDGATPGSGTIAFDGAALIFTGVNGLTAPVEFREMDSVKVTLPGAGSIVALANGVSVLGHQALKVSGTSGGIAFAAAAVDGAGTLTVDTRTHAGDDVITLTSAAASQGIIDLVVDAGTGADVVTASGTNIITGSLDLTSGGTLTQASLLTVGDHAAFTANGLLDFGGSLTRSDAGADTSIALTGGSVLLHSSITASGATTAVTIGGPVSLSGDTQITTNGDLSFTGAVDSSGTAHLLTLTGNDFALTGNLGGTSALQALTATAAGDLSLAAVTTLGGITLSAQGTLSLHGAADSGNGDFTIVAAGVAMDATASLAGHGALTITPTSASATIGLGMTTGSYDLSFGAADLAHFTDGFRSISIGRADSTGTLSAGFAAFHDPLTLRTGTGTIAVPGSLAGTGDASLTLLAGSGHLVLGGTASILSTESQPITLVGRITLSDDAQILADISGTGGDILATSLIDGAHSLTISGGSKGTVTLGSAVGSLTPLTALLLTGDTYNLPAITLTGSEVLSGHTINLNGDLTTGLNSTLSLSGQVKVNGHLTLSTGGGAFDQLTLDGPVLVDGSLALIANEIDLTGGAHSVTAASPSATLSLAPWSATQGVALGGADPGSSALYLSTTDLGALSSGFAKVTIGHAAGSGTFSIDSVSLNGPVVLQNPRGPMVSTGALQAAGDLTLTGKTIAFNGGGISGSTAVTVNGPISLGASTTIAGGGHVIINGAVTDAGAGSDFSVTAGTTLDLLHAVSVNGNQSYTAPFGIDVYESLTGLHSGGTEYFHGPVILSDSPSPISFQTTNGDITFGSTLDSFLTPQKEFILNAGTGAVHFMGAVGSAQPVNRFRIFSAASVTFDDDLTSDGIISIVTDAISFGGEARSVTHSAVSVTSSAAASVTLGGAASPGTLFLSDSTLNTLQAAGGPLTLGKTGLPLLVAGDLSLAGAEPVNFIGSKISIGAASLSASAAPLAFSAPVELVASTHLTGLSLTFSSGIDSAGTAPMDLTLETGTGTIAVYGAAGSIHPLGTLSVVSAGIFSAARTITAASVTTDAGGSTQLGGAVTTTGAQEYGDAVTANFAGALAGSGLHFASSLTGAARPLGLTLTSGAGGVAVDGTVTSFSSLTATSTSGNIAFNGLVALSTAPMSLQGNSVTIANPASSFGPLAVKATQTVMISKNSAIDLSNFTLLGDLIISAGGAITDSGNVSVAGHASFTTTGGAPIALDSAANHYNGGVAFSTTGNVTLVNASPTLLNPFAIGGTLKVVSSGDVTQSGPVQVGGAVSLTAKTGTIFNHITLLESGNTFGTLSLTGQNVAVTESASTDFGLGTVTGTLAAYSTGSITQSGGLTVTGVSSFTSGSGSVTLGLVANRLVGAVTLAPASGSDATLVNGRATVLAGTTISGRLQVTCAGTLSQSGPLIAATAVLAAGTTGDIVLNSALNDFGRVDITSGRTVKLLDTDDLVLGPSTLAVLDVVAGGDITQAGKLVAGGAATFTVNTAGAHVTLTDSGNLLTGAVSFNPGGLVAGETASLVNGKATVFGTTHLDGDLTVVSTGAILDAGAVQVNGTSTFSGTAGFAPVVTLDTATNQYAGPVVFGANLGNVVLVNALPTKLGGSVLSNNLTVVAPGGITQTGPLAVSGTGIFVTTNINITLDDAGNHLHTAIFSTKGGVKVVNAGNLDLGASSIGQSLEVSSTGAITDSGILSVVGSASFTAGSSITLDNANKLVSTVTLLPGTGAWAKLVNARATVLGTMAVDGDLQLTVGGLLTQSGALTVGGALTIIAGKNDISLNTADNHLSQVAVTTGRNVRVRDMDALTLGTSAVSGLLEVTAGGAIDQSGTLIVSGTSSFTKLDSGTAIDLTDTYNIFAGALSFQTSSAAGSDVTINNTRATILGTSTIGGDLTVMASGTIADSGNVTVNGASSFTANPAQNAVAASVIAFDSAGNHFGGPVSFGPSSVGAVLLYNAQATTLGASAIGGLLRVQSTGAITQSGPVSVGGASATFSAPTSSVVLDDGGNVFSHVSVISGQGAIIRDSLSLDFLSSSVGGSLQATSAAGITDTGVLTVGGDSTFTAATSVALDSPNKLTGAIHLAPGTGDASVYDALPVKVAGGLFPGNLSVRSAGAITQTDVLQVAGVAAFTTGVADITLPLANSLPKLLVTSGHNVTVNTITAQQLGLSFVTGTLSLTAGGALSQSDPLTAGTLALSANGAIAFNAANKLGILGAITTQSSNGAILINDTTLGLAINGPIASGASGLAVDLVTAGGNLVLAAGSAVRTPNGSVILAIANAGAANRFYNNTTGYPFDSGVHFAIYAGNKLGLVGNKLGNLTFETVTAVNANYDPTNPPAAPVSNVFYY